MSEVREEEVVLLEHHVRVYVFFLSKKVLVLDGRLQAVQGEHHRLLVWLLAHGFKLVAVQASDRAHVRALDLAISPQVRPGLHLQLLRLLLEQAPRDRRVSRSPVCSVGYNQESLVGHYY